MKNLNNNCPASLTIAERRSLLHNRRLSRVEAWALKSLSEKITLDAPVVENLLEGNLLPVASLVNDLPFSIPEYERPMADDEVFVVWNGADVGEKIVITDDTIFPLQLTLSKDLLTEGVHALAYRVKYYTGAPAASVPLNLKVKKTAPNAGNAGKGFVFPPEVVNEGISSEYLAANGDEVKADVPYYLGMEKGDVVQYYWATKGTIVGQYSITDADVAAKKASVAFPGQVIRDNGEGLRLATYKLIDRAGNEGPHSNTVLINAVLRPRPADLLAPVVPLADDGLIDRVDADFGVEVEVPKFSNALKNDLVYVNWGNQQLEAVTITDVDKWPLVVQVPRGRLFAAGDGDQSVTYRIQRGTLNYLSPELVVKVDLAGPGPVDPDPDSPENSFLEAPIVHGGVSNALNEIKPEDRDTDAKVTIQMYENAAVGERIKLYWGNSDEPAFVHALTEEEVIAGDILEFKVPFAVIQAVGSNPALPVFYTVSWPEGQTPENPVRSKLQTVKVNLLNLAAGLKLAEFPDVNERGWIVNLKPTIRVKVRSFPGIAIGDTITLSWVINDHYNGSGADTPGTSFTSSIKVLGPDEQANGVMFEIPWLPYVKPIMGNKGYYGQGQANYTVTREDNEFQGPRSTVRLDGIVHKDEVDLLRRNLDTLGSKPRCEA